MEVIEPLTVHVCVTYSWGYTHIRSCSSDLDKMMGYVERTIEDDDSNEDEDVSEGEGVRGRCYFLHFTLTDPEEIEGFKVLEAATDWTPVIVRLVFERTGDDKVSRICGILRTGANRPSGAETDTCKVL